MTSKINMGYILKILFEFSSPNLWVANNAHAHTLHIRGRKEQLEISNFNCSISPGSAQLNQHAHIYKFKPKRNNLVFANKMAGVGRAMTDKYSRSE